MDHTKTLTEASRMAPTAGKLFIKLLSRIRVGQLCLITPNGDSHYFGDLHQPLSATLQINDWRACSRIIRAGDIGFAESYENGWVDSPNLTALMVVAIKNESALDRMVFAGKLTMLWYRLKHLLRPNTRAGSKRNIHAHYDIGNAFYQLWLDPSWTYSSAIFAGDFTQSLEQAQYAKYQRIIDELGLKAGDRVLEIGCGWGGFACQAALQGISVHGITISAAQLAIAQQRVNAKGLNTHVNLALSDYRDLRGEYDAVVSIEMFEAVGERFWDEYFRIVHARLKPGGKAMVQSITIDERLFEAYRSQTDFIQQYIFPGGMLPSPERFERHAQKVGLQMLSTYAFGLDYAETLRRWEAGFHQTRETVLRLGFDERFMRIWSLYYCYCEAGFDEGKTNVYQFLMHKT
jgi:cyclopropane-fatty-acyl-phospholipid synthase